MMAAATLEQWFAVNELFIRYATSLDHCDVEAVVDCFAPDGWLDSPVLGRFEGAAGIREFAQRTARLKQEQGAQFRHVVSNLRVDVEGDDAKAWCYLLDFVTRDGTTELLSPLILAHKSESSTNDVNSRVRHELLPDPAGTL